MVLRPRKGKVRMPPSAAVLAFLTLACMETRVTGSGDSAAELLALHERVLAAHRAGDVEAWMSVEGDPYVSANGGTITFPGAAERRAMREPYLATTSFEVYRDVREPVVEVSPDGELGWVIAQVEVRGTQRGSDGTRTPVESVWAWIELYRRVEGEWKLVGNVSNRLGGP